MPRVLGEEGKVPGRKWPDMDGKNESANPLIYQHEPGLSLVFLAQQALPLLQRLVVAAEAMGGREGRQPGGPPPSESDGEAALSGMMRLLQPGESLLGTPGRKTGKAGKVKSAETVESDEDGEDSESEEEEEGEGAGDK